MVIYGNLVSSAFPRALLSAGLVIPGHTKLSFFALAVVAALVTIVATVVVVFALVTRLRWLHTHNAESPYHIQTARLVFSLTG